MRPLIGITADVYERPNGPTGRVAMAYCDCVVRSGGQPILLPAVPETAGGLVSRLDGVILTGGDDPRMEPFGVKTHEKAVPVFEVRQQFELELLDVLEAERPELPVLGVCLGMQWMALRAGGTLLQYLPDSHPDLHERHWTGSHPIVPCSDLIGEGVCHSHHHQAVGNPGSLEVAGHSDDGLIEAVFDPARQFYLGVQWHPERTDDPALGQQVFDRLLEACQA